MGPHRFLNEIPVFSAFDSIKALFFVILYLFALVFYSFISQDTGSIKHRIFTSCQSVLILIPFVIPFFLITFFLDLYAWIAPSFLPEEISSWSETLFLFILSLLLMVGLTLFLPPFIIKIWRCEPLEASPLKERLEAFCKNVHFRHAGMYIWSILNQHVTAAILGILPTFRYILFTRRLLNELSPDSIEAVLAHEIGHNYRRHLMIFPFIFLGMPVVIALTYAFFGEGIASLFEADLKVSNAELVLAYSLTIFLLSVAIICVYYRFVFGLFSRLFERQADLHGFQLGLDPQHMIKALQDIAASAGIPVAAPNWHHYSIQQRIGYLNACIEDPGKIEKHHQRTRRYLIGYSVILLFAILLWLALENGV